MTRTHAILLGGGVGRRFATGASIPKQFLWVGGAPVFIWALRSLAHLPGVERFVLTCPEAHLELARELVTGLVPELASRVRLIRGGERRRDSSRLALDAVAETVAPDRVLIHDACRPSLSAELLSRIAEKLGDTSFPAWIPVVPVVETLKRVEGNRVVETVDRSAFFRVQTPQIFDFDLIRDLSLRAEPDRDFTDDASICEAFGVPVGVFPGDTRNLKLTYEHERELLERQFSTEK